MGLWQYWLTTLQHVLAFFATDLHLGTGFAVILMTLMLRSALLPLTWSIARRGETRRRALERLKPMLERLREQCGDDRQRHAQETMKLYQREGVTLLDRVSLIGALIQFPVFVGMFRVLRDIQRSARFLWVADLARPDLWFAILAGVATMLLMAGNPDMPEHLRLLLIVVPAIFAILTALKFSAALSLYWTTTNLFTGAQTLVFRAVLKREALAEAPGR